MCFGGIAVFTLHLQGYSKDIHLIVGCDYFVNEVHFHTLILFQTLKGFITLHENLI